MPPKLVSCAHKYINKFRVNNITEEKDLVIIGGGVAGYVAAIKAGQEGMKVRIYLNLSFSRYNNLRS